MTIDSRYLPLAPHKRCGLPECWCTPPEPPKRDYGTTEAEPDKRMVPRALSAPWNSEYRLDENFRMVPA